MLLIFLTKFPQKDCSAESNGAGKTGLGCGISVKVKRWRRVPVFAAPCFVQDRSRVWEAHVFTGVCSVVVFEVCARVVGVLFAASGVLLSSYHGELFSSRQALTSSS